MPWKIGVPLVLVFAEESGWFRRVGMGKGTSDTARGGSQNPKQRRGRCPRFAPPFRIWDSTHPVGVVVNPACMPSGRRFAPGIPGFKSGSHGGSLLSVSARVIAKNRRFAGEPQ